MASTVIGTVQSQSNPDISYKIRMSDSPAAKVGEAVYCSCPAWRYSKTSPRSCKHMRQWRQKRFADATSALRSACVLGHGGAQYRGRPTVKRASDRERMRSAFSQLRHLHGFATRMNEPADAYRRVSGQSGNSVAFDRSESRKFQSNGHMRRALWVWFRGVDATAGVTLSDVMYRNGFSISNATSYVGGMQGVFIRPVAV
jgi:hypothetical protein